MPSLDVRSVLLVCSLAMAVLWGSPATAAYAIGGTVLDRDGHPIADAEVRLLPLRDNFTLLSARLDGRSVDGVATARTVEDGRFQVMAPRVGVWQVRVDSPNHVPVLYGLLPVHQTLELPPVILLPGREVEVMAQGPGKVPLVGAWLDVRSADPWFWRKTLRDGWRTASRSARLDKAGRATVLRAEGESLELEVMVSGRSSPEERRLESGAGETAVFHLNEASGQARILEVVGADGRAVLEAVVAVGPSAQPLGRLDGQGRVPIVGREGDLVHVFAGDGRRLNTKLDGSGVQRLVLPAAPVVSGRVLSASSRRPLGGALVWPGNDPGRFVLTDGSGHFDLPLQPSSRLWLQAEATAFVARAQGPRFEGQGWTPLDFVLTPSRTLDGRVVDGDGRPLAGVRIEASSLDRRQRRMFRPEAALGRGITDPDGRFRLVGIADGPLRIQAFKAGFSAASAAVETLEEPVRIVLQHGRAGFGQVVDQDDRPIEGAAVRVLSAAPGSGVDRVIAWTSSDGRFEFAALPVGPIDLEVLRDGFPPMTVRGLELPAGREAVDLGTLFLIAGQRLAGRVVDESGEPVAEAEVVALPAAEASFKSLANRKLGERTIRTDKDGRFAVEDLLPGQRVFLVANREGYLETILAGVDIPAGADVEIALQRASSVSGRVVDREGLPVPSAQVALSGLEAPAGTVGLRQAGDENQLQAEADADGYFVLAGVAAGDVRVTARAEGYRPSEPMLTKVGKGVAVEGLSLVLEEGVTLTGHVVDRLGEPLAGVELTVGPVRAMSDTDGRYRLSGLEIGPQSLTAERSGYNRAVHEIEIDGAGNRFDLTLDGGRAVRGRVVDEDGQSVAGAVVAFDRQVFGEDSRYTARTGAGGTFEIDALALGPYRVQAMRDGFATSELEGGLVVGEDPVDEVELVLRLGAELQGAVLGLDFDELADVEVEAFRSGRLERSAVVDYRGHYRLIGLGPGDWRVLARLRGGSREAEARLVIGPEIRHLERDLEFAGVTLSGQILFGDRPLPRTWVSLTGLGLEVERTVTTDHRGHFALRDLEPGSYRFSLANPQEWLVHNEDLEIYADRDVVVDLEPTPVFGQVTSNGHPVAGARVALQQMHGEQPGSLITVASAGDGHFHFARISSGSYRLSAKKAGYGPSETRLEVETGLDLGPLELQLEPTVGLALDLRVAGVRPPHAVVGILAGGRVQRVERRPLEADGLARFETLPEGRYELSVGAPGAASQRHLIEIPGPPVEVELAPASRLSVRVPALLESKRLGTFTLQGESGQLFEGVDAAGYWRREWVLANGAARVDGLPPGVWRLDVASAGGQRWQRTVRTLPGEEVVVRFE